ncbi:MAG: glycosyltransferase 4 family protein [archaeon]
MHLELLLPLIISFSCCFYIMPYWIRRARQAGLTGKDIHKLNKPDIAELGGVPVIIGFLVGILFYIGMETFYFGFTTKNLEIMAALSAVLITTVVAFIDDILGWKSGLRQWQKPVIIILAALPLAVVNSGESIIGLPFFGLINLGILYPVIFIPLAVTGAANGFNMLAGYNGLEAGMGIIILSTLGFVAWINNSSWVTMIALCMVFALIALYYFNRYPAKVFPGNITTYSVGAMIAVVAIIGNMERIAMILFIPYFLELVLKARGTFRKESFSKLLPDGSLTLLHPKFYGIEHVVVSFLRGIKGKAYEKEVAYTIFSIEAIIVVMIFLFI